MNPYLADVTPLPVHPTKRHPITGQPIKALGFRRNGDAIWPVMGGSQPLGGPVPGAVQPQPGQMGGQQPAQQFVPGLGGQQVPVLAPGLLPMTPPPAAGQQVQQQPVLAQGQWGVFGQPGQQVQQPYDQGGVMPPAPWMVVQPGSQQQMPFAMPAPGQTANGQQPGQPTGQAANGQQSGQPAGQQSQGGGQQTGNDGAWDKPYPQKPLAEMSVEEQNSYWKYHNRKLEDRIRQMGDYEQVKQQLGQLQQMTQTEWQRAVLDAESRGAAKAMEQAAGQMVAVAFQGAANSRMTPDQIQAQLGVLDPKRFVHNGQVDIAAIHHYVDTIAPSRQNGLVPLIPQGQHGQQGQLPLQQVTLGGYAPPASSGYGQQPIQPGQPGYGQQPTFGPSTQQAPVIGAGWQAPGQPQQQYGQPQQYGQQQYGQVPIPGVPTPYQPAGQYAPPVVQAAGMHGLPGLNQGRPGLPAAADFGQGAAIPPVPANPAQAGSAMAAARHGKTRAQQLAETRG